MMKGGVGVNPQNESETERGPEHLGRINRINKRLYLWWSLRTLYLHARQVSYRRRLRSLLLYLCYVF